MATLLYNERTLRGKMVTGTNIVIVSHRGGGCWAYTLMQMKDKEKHFILHLQGCRPSPLTKMDEKAYPSSSRGSSTSSLKKLGGNKN